MPQHLPLASFSSLKEPPTWSSFISLKMLLLLPFLTNSQEALGWRGLNGGQRGARSISGIGRGKSVIF